MDLQPATQQSRVKVGRVAGWIDSLLCVLAVFGVGLSLMGDFQNVGKLDWVAMDYKTVYASSVLFSEGKNPYDVAALQGVFRRDRVVLPRNSFGHMPVYPPPTLLLLSPLTLLPMGTSAVAWWMISMGLAAAALALVVREARSQHFGWGYRFGLIGFAAGTPMLAFALDIGNVSPSVGALATIALMMAIRSNSRAALVTGAACLGLALCLKPHTAIWIAVGMALICGKAGRSIAALGTAVFAGCGALSFAVLWSRGMLGTALRTLAAMLASERAGGSMSPSVREVPTVKVQITALDSLLGLQLGAPVRTWVAGLLVAIAFGVLLALARRSRWGNRSRAWQVLFVSAVFCVGMIATYHRAHDALLLPGLLGLWMCAAARCALRMKRWSYAIWVLMTLGLLAASWFEIPGRVCDSVRSLPHAGWAADLLHFRQAALASMAMAIWLIALAMGTLKKDKKDGTNGLLSVPGGQ